MVRVMYVLESLACVYVVSAPDPSVDCFQYISCAILEAIHAGVGLGLGPRLVFMLHAQLHAAPRLHPHIAIMVCAYGNS